MQRPDGFGSEVPEIQPAAPQPAIPQVTLTFPTVEKQYADPAPNQETWVSGRGDGGRGTWEKEGKLIVGFWEALLAVILIGLLATANWTWQGFVIGLAACVWGYMFVRVMFNWPPR